MTNPIAKRLGKLEAKCGSGSDQYPKQITVCFVEPGGRVLPERLVFKVGGDMTKMASNKVTQ